MCSPQAWGFRAVKQGAGFQTGQDPGIFAAGIILPCCLSAPCSRWSAGAERCGGLSGPRTHRPQVGMPDNQINMVNTITPIMAVTAMASATPSASRSVGFMTDPGQGLSQAGIIAVLWIFPKHPHSARQAGFLTLDEVLTFMNILTNYPPGFSGNVAAPTVRTTGRAQQQDLLMYVYDEYDQAIVDQRVNQFRGQTARFLAGQLSDAEFLPLRLQTVSIYSACADAADRRALRPAQQHQIAQAGGDHARFDKGYAHVSTRQNIQLNWPRLEEVPDILAELATVQMHAIQTSGNCIRNTTTDQYAGVATDELKTPPLLRDYPAVVYPASRIRLPATQVQDRRLRQPRRPGRDLRPRYRY